MALGAVGVIGPLRDVGPCEVWWGASTAAFVGQYHDSVGVRFAETDSPVFDSNYGTTPVDFVKTGSGACEVVVPFTRLTIAQLAVIAPGLTSTTATGKAWKAGADVGLSEYENAGPLILKPLVGGAAVSAAQYWFNMPKAFPMADFDITYNTDGQRVFNVTFKGLPDATTATVWYVGTAQ